MNGIIGLETYFPVSYTTLVLGGCVTLDKLIELMSCNAAKILGDAERGTLRVGAAADIAVFDLAEPYIIDPEKFRSKGRNTPFAGWEVYGRCLATVCGGEVIYREREN